MGFSFQLNITTTWPTLVIHFQQKSLQLPLLSLLLFVVVLPFLMLHKDLSVLYVVVIVVVLLSCICHNCFVGLFVYCVVSYVSVW